MESTKDKFLSIDEIVKKVVNNPNGNDLNPIDTFILHFQPKGSILANDFRTKLFDLVNYINE